MNEHRVPMLGAAWRRHVDPSFSRDPQVRRLVGALAGLEVSPPPRAEFRAELRAQLVAVAPRLIEEGATEDDPEPAPAGRPTKARAPRPSPTPAKRFRWGKPLLAAASVLTAFVLLLGGAVLLSRHALPGDALYGIKRASENTEYSLAGGNVDKGKLKLEFAGNRIGEVRGLVPSSGSVSSGNASLVRDTLTSANGDIQTASRLFGTAAVNSRSAAPLDALTSWAPAQLRTLQAIAAQLPAGAVRTAVTTTVQWLQHAQARAQALAADLGCSCLGTADSDTLGPLPCSGACTATPATGSGPAIPTPTRSRSSRPGHNGAGNGTGIRPGTSNTAPAAGTGAGSTHRSGTGSTHAPTAPLPGHASGSAQPTHPPTSSGPSAPSTPALPVLPGLGNPSGPSGSTKSTLPISVGTCGVTASLGPIGIGVGGC